MADTGGMLTRDRTNAVLQAADRLEELDERVAIMMETQDIPPIADALKNNFPEIPGVST